MRYNGGRGVYMINALLTHCLSKEGAYLDFPFGEIPAVVKVGGRIFAELYIRKEKPQITMKCEPVLARLLREKYPGTVIPGYHVVNRNKPYWNTVLLDDGIIGLDELYEMVDHSYHEVVKKLKKLTPTLNP